MNVEGFLVAVVINPLVLPFQICHGIFVAAVARYVRFPLKMPITYAIKKRTIVIEETLRCSRIMDSYYTDLTNLSNPRCWTNSSKCARAVTWVNAWCSTMTWQVKTSSVPQLITAPPPPSSKRSPRCVTTNSCVQCKS